MTSDTDKMARSPASRTKHTLGVLVALHVNLDKTPERRRETFTA